MKRYILSAALLFAATTIYAQEALNTADNAMRYSTNNLTGTARFRAMSGAFGALGGDLSAINVNPAGSAIFNYNSGTASLSSYNISNNATLGGTKTKKNDNSLDLNQLGAVFVFSNSNPDAVMRKFTLGFNYENTNSFHNTIYSTGITSNSIDRYFMRFANGAGEGAVPLSTLQTGNYDNFNFNQQQASLGYEAFIINPNSTGGYNSNAPATGRYYKENYSTSTGYNGKVALNFGTQLKDRLFLGANLNIHFTDYIQTSSLYEDPDTNVMDGQLGSVQFDNELYTYGGGFSFNLGAIYKITDAFRIGAAYESPTWMRLQNEITQRINSYCHDCVTGQDYFGFDPGIAYTFDDYTVKTPSKWTGSLAYIFGTNALLSVDYSIKDYSNTKYTGSRYSIANTELSSTLDVASELRVGFEYRIKQVSLRGGYRFEQSPYKNGTTVGDLNGATGGIGFAFPGSRLDLAYSWYQRKYDTQLLPAGYTDPASVKSTNNNVTLSYTIDL